MQFSISDIEYSDIALGFRRIISHEDGVMVTPKKLTFASVLLLASLNAAAAAGQSLLPHELAVGRFIAGWWTGGPEGTVSNSGIDVSLADGWKTYWRAPGEFGLPPKLEIVDRQNVDRIQIHFPRPSVFFDGKVRTIGYESRVMFPIEIVPVDNLLPASGNLLLHIGVCKDICIPLTLETFFRVVPGEQNQDGRIREAMSGQPTRISAADSGVRHTCRLEPQGVGEQHELAFGFDYPGNIGSLTAAVIESSDGSVRFSDASIRRIGERRLEAKARIVGSEEGIIPLSRANIQVTLISGEEYIEYSGCLDSAS